MVLVLMASLRNTFRSNTTARRLLIDIALGAPDLGDHHFGAGLADLPVSKVGGWRHGFGWWLG